MHLATHVDDQRAMGTPFSRMQLTAITSAYGTRQVERFILKEMLAYPAHDSG
jgi:hypothetical protein